MWSFYPPLVLCAAGLSYFVLPVTPLTSQLVMWAFLVLGTLAIWGVGRRLLDPAAGLLAALLFATAPFVVFSLLRFQLDLPLTAMVALALYAPGARGGLRAPGLVAGRGAGARTGHAGEASLRRLSPSPLAWSAWLALRAPDRGARLRRLGLALAVGVVLALPWYGPRLAGLPMQILNRSYKLATESPPTLSGSGLLFYPRTFVPQFGLLAGCLSLWGLWAVRHLPRARALVWSAILPLRHLRAHSEQKPALCAAAASRRRARRRGRGRRARSLRATRGSAPPASSSARCRSRWRLRGAAAAVHAGLPPAHRGLGRPGGGGLAPRGDPRRGAAGDRRARGPGGGGAERQLLLDLEFPLRGACATACRSASSAPGTSRPSAWTSPSSRPATRARTPPPPSPIASCAPSRAAIPGWPPRFRWWRRCRCPTAAAAWCGCAVLPRWWTPCRADVLADAARRRRRGPPRGDFAREAQGLRAAPMTPRDSLRRGEVARVTITADSALVGEDGAEPAAAARS